MAGNAGCQAIQDANTGFGVNRLGTNYSSWWLWQISNAPHCECGLCGCKSHQLPYYIKQKSIRFGVIKVPKMVGKE